MTKIPATPHGLTYMTDTSAGFTRERAGKNQFRYFDTKGRILKNEKHLARIKSLVIPPAWTEVWISPLPHSHLQVTGRDVRGRKQYRYHIHWTQTRNENKFSKMVLFAQKLPSIRKKVRADLRAKDLSREKVIASLVSIMEKTLIRIGNDEYARENSSYGLSTMRNRHAKVRGDRIEFKFVGKSGLKHEVVLQDERLAKIVRSCQHLPGQDLFEYLDEDGSVARVNSTDVNGYLQAISSEEITAKDFRTWGGTVHAAVKLLTLGPCQTKKDLKKSLVEATKETAKNLRNTVAVCRKYYIHPHVIKCYEDGSLFKHAPKTFPRSRTGTIGLRPEEKFALKILKSVS